MLDLKQIMCRRQFFSENSWDEIDFRAFWPENILPHLNYFSPLSPYEVQSLLNSWFGAFLHLASESRNFRTPYPLYSGEGCETTMSSTCFNAYTYVIFQLQTMNFPTFIMDKECDHRKEVQFSQRIILLKPNPTYQKWLTANNFSIWLVLFTITQNAHLWS